MIELGPKSAIPVTILTGFLGAGKTTLLNRILNGNHGLRVAVLVNDFGSVNVDAELIVGIEDDVMSLANGCVCCSIRDDLIETIKEVLSQYNEREQIIIQLYYFEELSLKEISETLGITESRISQIHKSVLKKIRDSLGSD